MWWLRRLWNAILPKKKTPVPVKANREYADIYSDKYVNDLVDAVEQPKA